MLNHIINILSYILPATRFFWIKRVIYKSVGFQFGENVRLGNAIHSYVLGSVSIGDETWIGRSVDFTVPAGTTVRIGANVDVAPYVKFQCGSHELGRRTRRAGKGRSLSITIGEGCWLGSSSTILAGAEIGAGSVVAAGSVVIAGKYPENALLAGVPAKPVKVYSN